MAIFRIPGIKYGMLGLVGHIFEGQVEHMTNLPRWVTNLPRVNIRWVTNLPHVNNVNTIILICFSKNI